MSTEATPSVQNATEDVAAEIRSIMGRRQVRQSQLARQLGENEQWLSVRVRGLTPINVNDLARIAAALGVHIVDLLPRDQREVTVGFPHGLTDFDAVVAEAPPQRHVAHRSPLAVNYPAGRRPPNRPGNVGGPPGPRRPMLSRSPIGR